MPSPFDPFASSPEPDDENTHLQEQDLLDDLSDEFFDCDEPPIREEDALRRREALHKEEVLVIPEDIYRFWWVLDKNVRIPQRR
jgi:hypothetical protein